MTGCLLCVFSGILINRAAGKDAATAGVMGSQSVYYEDYNRSKSEVRNRKNGLHGGLVGRSTVNPSLG